jgi:hypothetical protein
VGENALIPEYAILIALAAVLVMEATRDVVCFHVRVHTYIKF